MFKALEILLQGASARSEAAAVERFGVDLIDAKIREAERGLLEAKNTLAALVVRQRTEGRMLARLNGDIADLESRARHALADARLDLAMAAAAAIADLENEKRLRLQTADDLNRRIERMRLSIERAGRRMIDLRQGLIVARAADAERRAQRKLNRSLGRTTAIAEAEALIARVTGTDDPAEEEAVLQQIDAELSPGAVGERLAFAGYGPRTKVVAADIMARLAPVGLPITHE